MADLRQLLRQPQGIKEENRLRLLSVIMAKPGNQAYLSRRSGLSQAAVSEAVTDLEKAGFVRRRPSAGAGASTGAGTSGGNVVEMAPTTGVAVGVELGYQHTAIVARRVDEPHDRAKFRFFEVGATRKGMWLGDIAAGIREAVAEVTDGNDLATIGLGIPRMVIPRTGQLARPLLPPWDSQENPADELRRELTRADWSPVVKLDNDASLAALAESIYSFPEVETLVNVKVSTGVGAGIVISGHVYRGRDGVAGEIGHIVVDPNGRVCSCGGRGCLETFIGADALLEQARTVLGRRTNLPPSLEDLVNRAKNDDLVCLRVLHDAADRLGFALGNLCNALNPQVVIIGGAFGRPGADEIILERCHNALRQSAMNAAQNVKVVASKVEHAAAHGALVLGLQGTTFDARGVPVVERP
jgi:predicted NBD/HSP70 family sugar kinase